jgi:dephospho-CoA kinase
MLRVGLTGGIASGKTTVAELIKKRGHPVLDADALGHELMRRGQAAYAEIVRRFGGEVLGGGGAIDRSKLGAIVFADAEKRAELNQILHPPIRDAVQRWFASLDAAGGPPFAFVEAALLVEAGYRSSLDRLVVCWSKPEQQMERLTSRGLTQEQARLRMEAQMPAEEKRRVADDVIDCSGTLTETELQVERVLESLKRAAGSGRNIS